MWKQFDQRKKQQFIMTYLIFSINGMLALSIGSLLPFIRDARGLDYGFCGMLVSAHSVGNLASSFLSGALAVRMGRRKSILLFNSCFALAYLLILLGGHPALLLLAFCLTGLARGATSNFNNLTINTLLPGQAWALNGLHAMFSVGAFLFPILLMLLTAQNAGNWVAACFFMLGMGILSWMLYLLIPVDENLRAEKKSGGNSVSGSVPSSGLGFFREPFFWLCILTLFFYLCAEQGVIGWLITYFKDTGLMSPSLSQVMASVLWLMILAGRLTVAWLSTRVDKKMLLRAMGVGFVAFCILLLLSRSSVLIVAGIMGFGFSMAGIYPTVVSFTGRLMQKYTMAWSFILTFASLGSILMPSIIGSLAELSGLLVGMSSLVVAAAVDLILIFFLTGYLKRAGREADI